MNELVKNRERVASFFRHESVKYASWVFMYFDGGVINDEILRWINDKDRMKNSLVG